MTVYTDGLHEPIPELNAFASFDAHSKWLEVISVSCTTSGTTPEVLLALFVRFGISQQINGDKGFTVSI